MEDVVVNSDEIAVDEIEAVVPADEVIMENANAENTEDAVISGDEGISENNIFVD